MKRRSFLKSLIASGTALTLLPAPGFGYERRKPTIVMITDIAPDTQVSRLQAMLGAMLAKGLPVTCIVRTTAADGTRLRPDSELGLLLRGFLQRYPGLLEFVAYVPDLADVTEHFQARAAYHARKDLIEALIPETALSLTGPLLQSIACEHSDKPLSRTTSDNSRPFCTKRKSMAWTTLPKVATASASIVSS